MLWEGELWTVERCIEHNSSIHDCRTGVALATFNRHDFRSALKHNGVHKSSSLVREDSVAIDLDGRLFQNLSGDGQGGFFDGGPLLGGKDNEFWWTTEVLKLESHVPEKHGKQKGKEPEF